MKVTLKEIATIGAGQNAPQGDENYCNDGTPFVKAGNLQELIEGGDIKNIQKVSRKVAEEYRLKLFQKGTILFAKSGMSCMKGLVYVLPQDSYVVNHLACITPNQNLSEYLKFYFLFNKPNRLIKDSAYPSISLTDISNIEIEIEENEKREKIVNQLNNLRCSIKLMNNIIAKYDDLVKARFVEMFGDPESNEKEWKIYTFRDICTVRQGLQIPISDRLKHYEDDCYEYITVQYLHGGKDREYIKNPKSSVICTKNDILMTRTGNTGMVITGVEGVFHNNFFLIDFDRIRYDKDFLIQYLKLDIIQADILRRAGTSTIPDLNHSEFYKINVFLPPIKLQQRFADFVKQVDKSKFIQMNSTI